MACGPLSQELRPSPRSWSSKLQGCTSPLGIQVLIRNEKYIYVFLISFTAIPDAEGKGFAHPSWWEADEQVSSTPGGYLGLGARRWVQSRKVAVPEVRAAAACLRPGRRRAPRARHAESAGGPGLGLRRWRALAAWRRNVLGGRRSGPAPSPSTTHPPSWPPVQGAVANRGWK